MIDKSQENILIEAVYENKSYFYRIAKRILQKEEDVEDAIQEMILKGYKAIGTLRNREYIKTWLTRILINQCNNIIKKNRDIIYNDDSIIGIEELDYNKIEMIELINKLDDSLRVIAILFYYEDLPQKDISEILDIPIGTVKSRLSKVRNELKIMMGIGE
ncbi:MAG: sigma-70 family RNA polymerase sigma factor [Clostridiaceae bacterium]